MLRFPWQLIKPIRLHVFIAVSFCSVCNSVGAQSVLLSFSERQNGGAPIEIGTFDMSTCTYTPIITNIGIWFSDFLLAIAVADVYCTNQQ
jgi:polyferredoxin